MKKIFITKEKLMFQIKTKSTLRLLVIVVASVLAFASCAKKGTGVKAQVKTTQDSLNPSVSAAADQQAASQNANYTVASVSVPNQTAGGYTVDSQLKSPSGELIPVTTHHENGILDSGGTYTDSARGLNVIVNARCTTSDCNKYLLLVTVTRNNAAVYQTLVVSYSNDCKFHSVSSSGSVGQYYTSMNQAAASSYAATPARNDIDTCSN
jgi:hypothetical protein